MQFDFLVVYTDRIVTCSVKPPSMAYLWLVPLVIGVLGLVCSCEYIKVTVSDTNATWENTKLISGCKLVGLDRNGKLKPTVIRVLNHTGPLDAWIGAHVLLYPWINITGCFLHDNSSVSRIEDSGVDISKVRSPIETCFHQCSSEEFSITATGCYCLHDATYKRGIPCSGNICGSRNSSLCGHNNLCLCHYKQLRTDPVLNMAGNCMTIRKISNNYIYTPQNCSFGHPFLCADTNKSEITVYGTNSIGSWTDALSHCDHNNQELLGLNTQNFPKHTRELDRNLLYWIGMFRFQHFYWGYSKVDNSQCVSIHIMPNTVTSPELRFQNCKKTLPALCEREDNNQKVPSTAQNSSDVHVSTLPSASPTLNGVPLPPIIGNLHTAMNSYTISSSPQTSADISSVAAIDISSNVADTGSSSAVPLPPILGTAAGLVIVGLITSAVCLMKRRKRQNEHQNHTKSRHGANVAIDAHSSRYVDLDVVHNTPYSELSKNNGDPVQAECDYTYNHLHSLDRENERVDNLYHHTTDFRSEYDSLEKFNHGNDGQTESEYDHIKANYKFPSSADTGNYDTCIMEELDKSKPVSIDDTYDHM